jgi:serine/threonine-protein kinase
MSIWDRLKGALKPPVPPAPEPPPEPPSDESWLRTLLQRLADADDNSAGQSIGGEQFWAAIARLQANGRERTAIELLGRFVAARPKDAALAMRLAELLVERRDDRAARPLLERLLADEKLGLRARFLYGELLERADDPEAARRQYEAILATDLDYPRARARADALRKTPAQKLPPPAAPTIAGLPEGGAAFAGRYRLVRELGRGASGAVYVAHDEELDRELAIKILHPHTRAQKQAETRARAWLEARVAAGIRHPGVVAIYDLDEDRQLLAMELCSGGALRDVLARGALDPDVALRRAAELCDTLAAVHQRGVVHGDVKPANLLFRGTPRDGDLVLGDFGIARLASEKTPVDDRAARGTLAYMSPEQRKGDLQPAADLYAVGVILVELLSGTAALSAWLGSTQALLRGTARWDGRFSDSVEAALGVHGAPLKQIIGQLLADEAQRRPDAPSTARTLRSMLPG